MHALSLRCDVCPTGELTGRRRARVISFGVIGTALISPQFWLRMTTVVTLQPAPDFNNSSKRRVRLSVCTSVHLDCMGNRGILRLL